MQVLEETGYNLAGQVNPQHYLETVNNGQIVTLFIVPGVPEDYPFRTKTRKEISVSCVGYLVVYESDRNVSAENRMVQAD